VYLRVFPRALDTGGENLYIDTKDVQKLLIVGDLAVRLLITLGACSTWRKAAGKDCPTAKVLLEAKAGALHPKRYQSSPSKLSTRARRGKKRRQSDWQDKRTKIRTFPLTHTMPL
jgi:hypothetical protein